MKKTILGLVAFGCLIGLGLLVTRKTKKMREHCGQMMEHCKQMSADFDDSGEPAEEREPVNA